MTVLSNNTLGALFTVPEQGWTVINKRVGETATLASVTSYIEQYIPGFPLLIGVCDVWKNRTYDNMVRQSGRIVIYAQRAAERLEAILYSIKTTGTGLDTAHTHIRQQALELLISLTAYTVEVCKSMEEIASDISLFLSVNFEVDTQIGRFKDKLGLLWEPLGSLIPEINVAVSKTRMGWLDLFGQLRQFAEPTLDLTLQSLQHLDFETALLHWQNLEYDAQAFGLMADRQKCYWA